MAMPNELPPPRIWPEAKGEGYCVYIATSARLQDWAVANGHHYLFKVGRFSRFPFRGDTLNGRALRTRSIHSHPCLGFDDWQLVPCMDYVYPRPARDTERQVKSRLYAIFGRFDHRLLIGARPPSNGETEIFRISAERFDDAASYADVAVINRFVAPKVKTIVAAAVTEITRYRDACKRGGDPAMEAGRNASPEFDQGQEL